MVRARVRARARARARARLRARAKARARARDRDRDRTDLSSGCSVKWYSYSPGADHKALPRSPPISSGDEAEMKACAEES